MDIDILQMERDELLDFEEALGDFIRAADRMKKYGLDADTDGFEEMKRAVGELLDEMDSEDEAAMNREYERSV